MATIIIPAFNEESVIARTLASLLGGSKSDGLDIIVCCNGCSDQTAMRAREFGSRVRVLETATGSKTLALNMGDGAATSYPRIYLDADIALSPGTVEAIVEALSGTDALAVAPRMLVDLTGRNWLIRAFYDVWLRTPYHLEGMIGSGVYALSKAGRERFGEFPKIIADDGFVRAQFEPHERKILEACTFTVTPPATFSSLLKIKTRAVLGKLELMARFPDLTSQAGSRERGQRRWTSLKLAAQPLLWPKICVYLFVKVVTRLRAKTQWKTLNDYRWERDETTRH